MNETKGQVTDIVQNKPRTESADTDSFVLEKTIFNNVFDKDIKRIYLYKKAERLAKAIQLITPAFKNSRSLLTRLEQITVGLVDAAVASGEVSKDLLARELLSLSSILGIAKTAGILTPMNADFISQEAHQLLQEVAGYEAPRVTLEDVPSIAMLARASVSRPVKKILSRLQNPDRFTSRTGETVEPLKSFKGQIEDIKESSSRRESILSVMRSKGSVYIKDVSMVVRDVSEKTIQRELQALVVEGVVTKSGERRWTRYSLTV